MGLLKIMARISVIINTKCVREKQLFACIRSIQKGTYKDYEIIVVQQGLKVLEMPKRVKTYKALRIGTGFAKNVGIKHAIGKYIVFTDDDCIVSRKWLQQIESTFERYPKALSVFGKVLPYQPKKNAGRYCPATVVARKDKFFDKPTYHGKIGSGNNMSYRAKVFKKLGGFKKWLGPGSVGINADDAEMVTRLLHNKLGILYNPNVVVYHDRWLDKQSYSRQKFSYTLGEIACYTFYAIRNNEIAQSVTKGYLYGTRDKVRVLLQKIRKGQLKKMTTLMVFIKELLGITYAFLVGAVFSLFSRS
jgi:GT2 family glycosyltransferase